MMKRVVLVLLTFLLATGLFAQELTWLHEGDAFYKDWPGVDSEGFSSLVQKVVYKFEKANPGVRVRPMVSDISTGSNFTLDTQLASGNPPDVITRTGMMVSKLMNDTWAIRPGNYVSLDDYSKFGLEAGSKNGVIYALPIGQAPSVMAVNLDDLASVGYTLPAPEKWTTDEYLSLARKLKAKGKYITALFAQNQSSDHWWMYWFIAFGAKLYDNGDYTKTALNSPQAVKALKFMKQLQDEGLIPPNPGELNDDMALDMWCKKEITTLAMQIGHAAMMQAYVKQGIVDKEFAFTFVEFPHAPGMPRTPAIAGVTLAVGHKTKDEKRNALVAKLMIAVTGVDVQILDGYSGNFPTSKSAIAALTKPNPYWKTVKGILDQVGFWDRGSMLPQFPEIRAQMFPLMQEFYAGRITAENLLKKYESKVNEILAR
jgi:ABC-type glycerol-3-phosphate transport system substrate-binding protein